MWGRFPTRSEPCLGLFRCEVTQSVFDEKTGSGTIRSGQAGGDAGRTQGHSGVGWLLHQLTPFTDI